MCEQYMKLDQGGKETTLLLIARKMGVDLEYVKMQPSSHSLTATNHDGIRKVRDALRPLYDTLFHQAVSLPGGTQFLLNLRSDVLRIIRTSKHDPALRALNRDLQYMLIVWFNT